MAVRLSSSSGLGSPVDAAVVAAAAAAAVAEGKWCGAVAGSPRAPGHLLAAPPAAVVAAAAGLLPAWRRWRRLRPRLWRAHRTAEGGAAGPALGAPRAAAEWSWRLSAARASREEAAAAEEEEQQQQQLRSRPPKRLPAGCLQGARASASPAPASAKWGAARGAPSPSVPVWWGVPASAWRSLR